MVIKVLYFAAVQELVGSSEESFPWAANEGTLAQFREALYTRHPALREHDGHLRFAINESFATNTATLKDGDEVAVIPPVAGGTSDNDRVRLTQDPLSVDRCRQIVQHDAAGAIALFVGAVRDHNDGLSVQGLEYTAYEAMALREMKRIVKSIEAEVPETRLCVHHRIGALNIGELAVVCAASSPHRDAAFKAGRMLIDRIKADVPIWKKEHHREKTRWVGWEDARRAPESKEPSP